MTVTLKGPLTKEQKDAQDQLVAMRPKIEKSIHASPRQESGQCERSPNTS